MSKLVFVGCAALLGCGGGGDGDPDARPPLPDAPTPDAAPKTYCLDQVDAACGYTAESLTPADISLADQLALAERFNPAMVMTGPDVWAVKVDYALVNNNGGLMRAEHDGRLNFTYDVDMSTAEVVAGQPSDLTTLNLRTLPLTAPSTRGYAYFVDVVGDNLDNTAAGETWSSEWRTAQGYANPGEGDPAGANFPPNQYAHLFWLSKPDSLVAISYWFYYPYDKFNNNHEGDWEHVNVVIDYEDPGAPFVVGAHFSWHGRQSGFPVDQLYMVGEHVVVFTGGETCTMYNQRWCGNHSGASWPYPGTWKIGYDEEVAGYTGKPGRAIAADVFTVTLLPRPEDIDFDANPELSWFEFPFLAGDPIIEENDPVVMSTNNHRAPVGPGPDHEEYDHGIEETFDILRDGVPRPFAPPTGWTLSNEPPASVFP